MIDKDSFSNGTSDWLEAYCPESRVGICQEEYEKVRDAVDLLTIPHIDHYHMDEIMDGAWLQEPEQ